MERVLWFLVAGSKGGPNRARILMALSERPSNPHQLSERLELNYKTVTHHLRLLERHELVVNAAEGSYGSPYFLSKLMEHYLPVLQEIMEESQA
ncbi:MAG: winged helix-turn-helix domain-containing protein [Thermoplasmata archaeon]|nr:winged helix-turn-helix domain-containing protein [Thermoplasmata archaeon]